MVEPIHASHDGAPSRRNASVSEFKTLQRRMAKSSGTSSGRPAIKAPRTMAALISQLDMDRRSTVISDALNCPNHTTELAPLPCPGHRGILALASQIVITRL